MGTGPKCMESTVFWIRSDYLVVGFDRPSQGHQVFFFDSAFHATKGADQKRLFSFLKNCKQIPFLDYVHFLFTYRQSKFDAGDHRFDKNPIGRLQDGFFLS